jgi:hypothetical protein
MDGIYYNPAMGFWLDRFAGRDKEEYFLDRMTELTGFLMG